MTQANFDEQRFADEIRKFLKKVGITSHIELENAVRAAAAGGNLDTSQPLRAQMVLEVPAIGLRHVIDHSLQLE
jgi:hypothetical protein